VINVEELAQTAILEKSRIRWNIFFC
jgi:hypothetical protein